MIYATKEELLKIYLEYIRRVDQIFKLEIQVRGAASRISFMEKPFMEDAAQCDLSIQSTILAEYKLVKMIKVIGARINKRGDAYIQDINGLTQDTRNVRRFIAANYNDCVSKDNATVVLREDPAKITEVVHILMQLLHTLSLNDIEYYNAFRGGRPIIAQPIVQKIPVPVIYSVAANDLQNGSPKLADDPCCQIAPDFSKCRIM